MNTGAQRIRSAQPVFFLTGQTLNSKNLMIRKLFSSQLRINMVSGVVATVVNVVGLECEDDCRAGYSRQRRST